MMATSFRSCREIGFAAMEQLCSNFASPGDGRVHAMCHFAGA
jgi:hypothetical protein